MKVKIENGVLVSLRGVSGGEYITPEGVTKIGAYALEAYFGPERFVVSEGVTEIGANAFFLTCVKTIELPESLVRICDNAFCCAGITHYILPDKPIAVGTQAFYGYNEGGARVTIRRSEEKGGDLELDINMGESSWDHTGYHYIMKMIVERDFSQKVKPVFKNPIVARMCLAGIPEAEDYVKRGFNRIFKTLCELEDEDIAARLVRTGRYVTAKNIEKLTDMACGREVITAALNEVWNNN